MRASVRDRLERERYRPRIFTEGTWAPNENDATIGDYEQALMFLAFDWRCRDFLKPSRACVLDFLGGVEEVENPLTPAESVEIQALI